jgi:hypothetical protein
MRVNGAFGEIFEDDSHRLIRRATLKSEGGYQPMQLSGPQPLPWRGA